MVFTIDDVGCIFDGNRGYEDQGKLIQRLAMNHGMENFERVDSSESEHFDDAVNEAIEYLNSLAPDEYLFGFQDGDFGLYSIAWLRQYYDYRMDVEWLLDELEKTLEPD